MKEELESKVEEIKKDAHVQRALKQASPVEKAKRTVARTRDKLLIGTHVTLLFGLGVVYQLLRSRFPDFLIQYPLLAKLILAVAVIIVCLIVLRLLDVYFVGRAKTRFTSTTSSESCA